MYKNKKIFILGMARSGYEVAKLLAKDNKVFITDMKEQDNDKVEELENLGVIIKICDDPTGYLDDSYDIMVKNPGIKYNHPCVVKAKKYSIYKEYRKKRQEVIWLEKIKRKKIKKIKVYLKMI